MKIVDERNVKATAKFKELIIGECFFDVDDELCMKISIDKYPDCAVVLRTGHTWCYDPEEEVIRAEAVIKIIK